jgi:hypothetical protein
MIIFRRKSNSERNLHLSITSEWIQFNENKIKLFSDIFIQPEITSIKAKHFLKIYGLVIIVPSMKYT